VVPASLHRLLRLGLAKTVNESLRRKADIAVSNCQKALFYSPVYSTVKWEI
jgi:hypothetical protein